MAGVVSIFILFGVGSLFGYLVFGSGVNAERERIKGIIRYRIRSVGYTDVGIALLKVLDDIDTADKERKEREFKEWRG